MKLLNLANEFWDYVLGAIALVLTRTKLARFLFKKVAGVVIKPFYDYVVRYIYVKIKKEKAEKAEEEVENAKPDDVRDSIDRLP